MAANASSTREPVIADSHVAMVCRSRCAVGSDVPAAARITESSRPPTGFDEPISQHPHQIRAWAERRGDRDIGMSGGGHVRRNIGADVIAARHQSGNQHRWFVGYRPQHLGGRRTQYIDKRDVYLLVQNRGHPLRQVADHSHAPLLASAVRHQ